MTAFKKKSGKKNCLTKIWKIDPLNPSFSMYVMFSLFVWC